MKMAGVDLKEMNRSSEVQIDDDVVVEQQEYSESMTYESP